MTWRQLPSALRKSRLGSAGPPGCGRRDVKVRRWQIGGQLMVMTVLAAGSGDISNIINGIAPNWGPFGSVGQQAKVLIEVIMAAAILICLGIAIWGAAKQRIGATALRDSFSAEQGKGLIIAGLTGVFIIGSLSTLFTIVYGMAI
jgi:hypothetical protein